MATRIKEKYLAEAVPALQQKFGYKNVMEIPKLDKIVINMGLGDCKDNAKAFEMAINELTTIAGQKPMVTKAKKSIANFKLREGHEHRREGYPARRPHGRIHGQAGQHCAAPRP